MHERSENTQSVSNNPRQVDNCTSVNPVPHVGAILDYVRACKFILSSN